MWKQASTPQQQERFHILPTANPDLSPVAFRVAIPAFALYKLFLVLRTWLLESL